MTEELSLRLSVGASSTNMSEIRSSQSIASMSLEKLKSPHWIKMFERRATSWIMHSLFQFVWTQFQKSHPWLFGRYGSCTLMSVFPSMAYHKVRELTHWRNATRSDASWMYCGWRSRNKSFGLTINPTHPRNLMIALAHVTLVDKNNANPEFVRLVEMLEGQR